MWETEKYISSHYLNNMFIDGIKLYLRDGTTFDVLFEDGITKRYNIMDLSGKFPQLLALNDRNLFLKGHIGAGGIEWNDELNIAYETIYEDGITIENNDNVCAIVLGYKIKQLRLKAQLTQIDVYKTCGISQADLSRIEKGQLNPSIQLLQRIAKGLGKELTIDFK